MAHALYSCERVSLYGFFLDPGSDDIWKEKGQRQADKEEHSQETAQETPYHYYENHTVDMSAKDPKKPWTYRYHNFELEHGKYRQLESVCWLHIVT